MFNSSNECVCAAHADWTARRRGEVKFIYSEKATKFCEISTIDLSYVVPVKSSVEISQNFVSFSEYVNFKNKNAFFAHKKIMV